MNYNIGPQPYQSMYVDMKLPQIAQIERDRFDMASAEKDAIDRSIGSMRLLPLDENVKNKLNVDIRNIIGGRVDFENMGRVVKDATTRLLTDTKLLDAADSYATRQKELEAENAMIAQGLKPLDFNYIPVLDQNGKAVIDPATGLPMRQHRSEVWNTETQGKYRTGIEEKLKWEDKAQQLIAGIADDSGPIRDALFAAGISDNERKRWLSTGQGVTADKINRIADELTDVFAETAEGRQMSRELKELQVNPGTMSLHSDAEVKAKIKELLWSVGAKQEGWVNNPFKSAIDYDSAASASTDPSNLPSNIVPVQSDMTTTFDLEEVVDNQMKSNLKATDKDKSGSVPLRGFNAEGKYVRPAGYKGADAVKKRFQEAGHDWRKVDKEWLSMNKHAMIDFLNDPVNGYKKYQGSKESDAAFTKRMGKVLGSINQEELTILPDQANAAKSLLSTLSTIELYNKNGVAMKGLEELAADGNTIGTNDLDPDDIRTALNHTVNGEWDGKGISPAEVYYTGKGVVPGSFKVVIDGESFYARPLQDMGRGYEISNAAAEYHATKSVIPRDVTSLAQSVYGEGIDRAYVVNTPEGAKIQTDLIVIPTGGKPFRISMKDLLEESKKAVLRSTGRQSSQAAESLQPTYKTNTKFK